jgi:hypothetical protein
MKKFLSVLTLVLSLVACQADYYTGAFWTLRGVIPAEKEAGSVDVTFYDDGTVEVDFFWDNEYLFTADGFFTEGTRSTTFSASYSTGGFGGKSFFVRGVYKNGLVTGSFTTYYLTQTTKGKLQATVVKD